MDGVNGSADVVSTKRVGFLLLSQFTIIKLTHKKIVGFVSIFKEIVMY
jgi:hypothetical protein